MRISHSELQPQPGPAAVERQPRPSSGEGSPVRQFLLARGNSAFTDRAFHALMVLCALSIFGIVALIAVELVLRSEQSWHAFGFNFFVNAFTDPDTKQP